MALSRRAAVALRIVHSPDAARVGQSLALSRGQTLFIGRDVEDGFKVEDGRMSRTHLFVMSARGAYEFADAGTTNGTFVNGLPCRTRTLRDGDVIRAGDTLLVVSLRDAMAEVREIVARIAPSPFPVSIQGETGSGKELVARAIHAESGRSGAFLGLNCATLSRELAAAELFGHARGAFSGAGTARPGLFRSAEGGTLFLDEIGDLPPDVQPALLRAIEERKVRPVGADSEVPVDVRILSATHVDLEAAAEARTFQSDLLARIAHIVIRVPPLRERRQEILQMASQFSPGLGLSPNAAEALLLWHWPRNVRELRALVEVAALTSAGPSTVRLSDLEARVPGAAELVRARRGDSVAPEESHAEPHPNVARRAQLLALLEANEGNVSKVAEKLGKQRAQVYRWVKALGLDIEKFRKG